MTINQGMLTSATPEWYTPPALVSAIADFFGGITLDPCADPEHRIPAEVHYSLPERDGLALPWNVGPVDEVWGGQWTTVYMNPPYGREIGAWVDKALSEPVAEVVMLLPARTDTTWFQPLFEYPICFIRGRLKFSGHTNSAPFPSALVYVGEERGTFRKQFARWGAVI